MKDKAPDLIDLLLNPPPHVSKRCDAYARTTGLGCRKWACIGSNRCRLHGGARGSGRPVNTGKHTKQRRRENAFVAFTRYALARHHDRLEPVEPSAEILVATAAPFGPYAVAVASDEEDNDT